MKKQIPKIRVFGQRSIAASFLNRSPIPKAVEGSPKKEAEIGASLSDFLDSKTNKSVMFKPKNIEEERTPFTHLVSSKDLTELSYGFGMEKKVKAEKANDVDGLEKTMLQQFKPKENQINEEMSKDIAGEVSLEPLEQPTIEETDMALYSTEFDEVIIVKDGKQSRKRKDPFKGMETMSTTRKPVIVLGDNSKVSQSMQRERERGGDHNSKKQRPTYNHYANGSGWWDCDMEGVDSEEVGHSEVWEGVGSTTFGDTVDWH